ncbi:unnamed protein product [Adineta ricciae]|uniref:Mitochondrial inner membrane protein Mpv17 n=1 Tax=Adineta ricciae TaxID=249248 RepID=A0A815LEX1_ADIRI|nr:unnamed protein product [Adineta ricciae]CAF1403323.1 unnamed protein product [Adineta ricciae]
MSVTTSAVSNTAKAALRTQHGWRRLVKPYIYSTLAISASVTVGDFICQYLQRHHQHAKPSCPPPTFLPWWDRRRSAVMCTTAVLVSTPWNFTISRTIERIFPGKQIAQIGKKMLINILVAPIGISLVFTSVTLLKGQTISDAKKKVKEDMPKTYLAGSCYWPFVSFVNFRFIPLDYRPFVASLAGAIWNIYISSVANKTHESLNESKQSTSNVLYHTNKDL